MGSNQYQRILFWNTKIVSRSDLKLQSFPNFFYSLLEHPRLHSIITYNWVCNLTILIMKDNGSICTEIHSVFQFHLKGKAFNFMGEHSVEIALPSAWNWVYSKGKQYVPPLLFLLENGSTLKGNSLSFFTLPFGKGVFFGILQTSEYMPNNVYPCHLKDRFQGVFVTQHHIIGISLDESAYPVKIFFLFLQENICCGFSIEAPLRGASCECPQHMVL